MTGELARMAVECGPIDPSLIADIISKLIQARASNHMVDIVLIIRRRNSTGEPIPVSIKYIDYGR